MKKIGYNTKGVIFKAILITMALIRFQTLQGQTICPCGVIVFNTSCPCISNYRDADGDELGNPNIVVSGTRNPSPGYVINNTDRNDGDKTIYPGAPELCDGKDNNCNGIIEDNSSPTLYYFDGDGDGFGNPAVSDFFSCNVPLKYIKNNKDCDDSNPLILGPVVYYKDFDKDGGGDVNSPLESCNGQPAGYVLNSNDCDDQNVSIKQLIWVKDADSDGIYIGNPVTSCTSPGTGYVLENSQQPNDCNDDDPLNAKIIYVKKNAAGTLHNGKSWANAYITLKDALNNTNGCTAQIWVHWYLLP